MRAPGMVLAAGTVLVPPVLIGALVLGFFGADTPTTNASVGVAPAAASVCGVSGSAAGLQPEQQFNARAIVSVAQARGLGKEGAVMGIMTAFTESTLINVAHGDRMGPSSRGLFQQMPGWGPLSVRMDPAGSAGLFFDALSRVAGWQAMPPWVAAQTVQQSEFTDGANYRTNFPRAMLITDQLLADASGAGDGSCGAPLAGGQVAVDAIGTRVTLPAQAGISGVIFAPTPAVARAIAAGLTQLGVPYSWGGGNASGPTVGIRDGGIADCSRRLCEGRLRLLRSDAVPLGAGEHRSAAGLAGPGPPGRGRAVGGPASRRHDRVSGPYRLVPRRCQRYRLHLEAPYSGSVVRVAPVRNGHYATVARIWQGTS